MQSTTSTEHEFIFFTATKHEAACVQEAGYDAESFSEANIFHRVSDFKDYGKGIISMLNEDGNQSVWDACENYGIPCRLVSPTATLYGFRDNGRFLKEVLDTEAKKYIASVVDANNNTLTKYGIHFTTGITFDIITGIYVRECMPTGIDALDKKLGGGLPRGGVTTIGAISSAGKTSLCNQIADDYAKRGVPVLFATLEQSRYELAVMSLSRIIGMDGYNYANPIDGPKVFMSPRDPKGEYPTRQWLQSGPSTWSSEFFERAHEAAEEYNSYANEFLHVLETDNAPTVKGIWAAAEAVSKIHGGKSPVVIIDYLQILDHSGKRDERLAVNEDMSTLRRMARKLETAVVVISALNRASLTQGVTLSAFRESGGIEYASDLVLGLQPLDMTEKVRKSKELKPTEVNKIVDDFRDAVVKDVDVRVLKNRAGAVPKDGAHLKFDGRIGYFFEDRNVEDGPDYSDILWDDESNPF